MIAFFLPNRNRKKCPFFRTVTHETSLTRRHSDIYLDLVVKRFEFTYEMSWKAIKRYLDFIGIDCTNPRGCFKEGFSQELLDINN